MIRSALTSHLQGCIDRLAIDDAKARDELITHACERLRVLTRNLSRGDRVRLFADTDDVLDGAVITLRTSLQSARPADCTEFLRLAAFHIRRELARLAREYHGPSGWATRRVHSTNGDAWSGTTGEEPASSEPSPCQVAMRNDDIDRLYVAVDSLPEDLRDVVDLLWLHGLQQREAAEILGVTTKTIQRRWVRARTHLHRILDENSEVD